MIGGRAQCCWRFVLSPKPEEGERGFEIGILMVSVCGLFNVVRPSLLIEQQLDGCSTSTSRPRFVRHWIFIVAEHYIEHAERILCLGCLDLLIVDYLHAAVI